MNRIHPGQPIGWSLKLHRVQHFDPTLHFPQTLADAEEKPYFQANSPQQVYGYFIREDYEKGPLVLAIESEKYDPSRVVHPKSAEEVLPVDNPDSTP